MIAQPPVVTSGWVEQAVDAAGRKKDIPARDKIRFEATVDGLSDPRRTAPERLKTVDHQPVAPA